MRASAQPPSQARRARQQAVAAMQVWCTNRHLPCFTPARRAHTGDRPSQAVLLLGSMSWIRTAVSSFTLGFSVAAVGGLYTVRNDLWESHRILAAQVSGLVQRVDVLRYSPLSLAAQLWA